MLKQKRLNDLVCYSHLRWGFVYQRPQHLMSRFARERRVYFIEEAERADVAACELRVRVCDRSQVNIVTPLIPRGTGEWRIAAVIAPVIEEFFIAHRIRDYVAWFYTPMALDFAPRMRAQVIVYDCMDELSLFRGAPAELVAKEQELFRISDLVFTGGVSLFEAKRRQHQAIYPFPSSVDCDHFAQARSLADTQEDQRSLARPRLGYAGVIDERIDLELIDYIAAQRPDWQIVMIGPTAKIDPATLPMRSNIHWLGMKSYSDLPRYFAGWDVALMPFAMNDATRYISPTKTPEYLAAGLPVVSTPIRDVVRQYGESGLALIGATADEFLAHVSQAVAARMDSKTREKADAFLRTLSWDRTWKAMGALISEVAEARSEKSVPAISAPVLSGGVA